MSNTDRDLAVALMGKVLENHTKELCHAGLSFADLGGAACFSCAREKEGTKSRSVVFVLAGPIPDDLVQAAGQYMQGLTQDLKADGTIKTINES